MYLNSRSEKWKIKNFIVADDLVSQIFRSSNSWALKKDASPYYFFKFQENVSRTFCHHLKGF